MAKPVVKEQFRKAHLRALRILKRDLRSSAKDATMNPKTVF
jgi:hypothetical protein